MRQGSLKLSIEERESLQALTESELYGILQTVLAHLADRIDEQVLIYDLGRGPDGLVIAKARAEGARILQREFTKMVDDVAKKQK